MASSALTPSTPDASSNVGWHEINNRHLYETGDDESESGPDESRGRQMFRVIPVITDTGLDTIAFEAALNAAGSDGYSLHETLLDQPLAEGSRGHVFLLSKYVYDGDDADIAPVRPCRPDSAADEDASRRRQGTRQPSGRTLRRQVR